MRNAMLTEIRRNMRKLFNLRYFEVDIFVDDLLVNLETLNADINTDVATEFWDELKEAARALQHVGENLQQRELQRIGVAYEAAAKAGNRSDAEAITARFEVVLKELGCTGIEVSSEEG